MVGLIEALQALVAPRGLEVPGANTLTSVPANPAPTLLPALSALDAAVAALRQESAVLEHQRLLLHAAQQSGHPAASDQVLGRVAERSLHIFRRLGGLLAQRERVLERLEQDSRVRSLAARGKRPGFSLTGPDGPLGKQAAALLRQAQVQTLDRVLRLEQSSGQECWSLKDRLDGLEAPIATIERSPLAEGWPALLRVLAELEGISVAVAGPGSDQGNSQEQYDKATE